MTKQNIIKYALVNGLWTALYIILIGAFFNNAQAIFGVGSICRDGFDDGRALCVEMITSIVIITS